MAAAPPAKFGSRSDLKPAEVGGTVTGGFWERPCRVATAPMSPDDIVEPDVAAISDLQKNKSKERAP